MIVLDEPVQPLLFDPDTNEPEPEPVIEPDTGGTAGREGFDAHGFPLAYQRTF